MSFEDELRALMHAHDGEAPATVAFDPAPASRRRGYVLPAFASAAVILVVVGVAALLSLGRGRQDSDRVGAAAPPSCPAHFGTSESPAGWVPARSTVPRSGARLVPDAMPIAAVTCGYVDGTRSARRLTGLASIRSTLTLAPRNAESTNFCLQYRTQYDSEDYLLGLRYADGTLWVSAPRDHCAVSGNGRFASRLNLGRSAAAALRTGHWPDTLPADPAPGPKTTDACAVPNAGRLGDDRALVPPGVTGARICDEAGPAGRTNRTHTLTRTETRRVLSLLGRLPTEAATQECHPSGSNVFPVRLVLSYPTGPSEVLSVYPQCGLWADNGALHGVLTANQVLELRKLLN